MAWTKKPAAPEYFSLADAFLALITGDSNWGWLVDWLTLVPSSGFVTADFCAEGPIFTEPLVVTDFFPTSNPLDPRNAVATVALAARITAAARDRVFGAYCESLGAGPADGSCVAQGTFPTNGTTSLISQRAVPAGVTGVGFKNLGPQMSGVAVYQYDSNHGYLGMTGSLKDGGFAVPWDTTYYLNWPSEARYMSVNLYDSGARTCTFELCYVNAPRTDVSTPHEPTEQPLPDGVTSPLGETEATLEAIAHELDRQEFKLDTLWSIVQSVAGATLDLGGPLSEPVDVVPGDPIPLLDAVGVVVSVSGIPAQLDVGFGDPQEIADLGRIVLGTSDAWYPMIPLTHSPMIVRPLPPGCTRVVVTGLPPMVDAQVTMIQPLK